jgi:hypothetical protein
MVKAKPRPLKTSDITMKTEMITSRPLPCRRDRSEQEKPTFGGHCLRPRRLRATVARGGAYTFPGGKGSRTGSGLSLARIALGVRLRGENG